MTRRFRLVAGPNGSGKSTLVGRLATDYAVNFYLRLNADDIFAQVRRDGAFQSPFPVDGAALAAFASGSGYGEEVVARFLDGGISIYDGDCFRFNSPEAANSYTVALLVGFLQDECIRRGVSFSQETVLSHPSKVEALAKARAAGFRTYLYFVATDNPAVNVMRVAERRARGGHDVPPEKIAERHARSLALLPSAMQYLSRAFFFDNSGLEMRYIAAYDEVSGLAPQMPSDQFPRWFSAFSATL